MKVTHHEYHSEYRPENEYDVAYLNKEFPHIAPLQMDQYVCVDKAIQQFIKLTRRLNEA